MLQELHGATTEALAWKVIAEFVRRHPTRLWVATETHSVGSEQAFVIDMSAPMSHLILFGLPGENVAIYGDPSKQGSWRAAYDPERDPRDWLAELELAVGLRPDRSGLPASTASSIAIRLVSQFLLANLGARDPWIAGSGRRWSRTPNLVPPEAQWVGKDHPDRPLLPLYVGTARADEPTFAVTPGGEAWLPGGASVNLLDTYRSKTSVTELAVAVLGDWLP
jgi:hypothetical protein